MCLYVSFMLVLSDFHSYDDQNDLTGIEKIAERNHVSTFCHSSRLQEIILELDQGVRL